jgi:hypothetical protein
MDANNSAQIGGNIFPFPSYRCSGCSRLLVSGESDPCAVCLRRRRENAEDELFELRARVERLEAENRQMRAILAELGNASGQLRTVAEAMQNRCEVFGD